ncbi:MAG: TetR/AcrR family transcriptional regulator [Bacteroidia bacterium]|nr:TetR/AcrR family transcriptional regulator [Bacteroidia bacterium]
MPLLTYYNLTEERQQKIMHASLKEFAYKGYESASLTRVIKEVGVAKGSFYRYFKHKLDLYTFLVDSSLEHKNEFTVIQKERELSFFELLHEKYFQGISFYFEHPLEGRLICNMMRERNCQELDHMLGKRKRAILKSLQALIEKYQFKGELSSELDRKWLAFQIQQLEYNIIDYLSNKLDVQPKSSKAKPVALGISESTIEETIKGAINILSRGIKIEETQKEGVMAQGGN